MNRATFLAIFVVQMIVGLMLGAAAYDPTNPYSTDLDAGVVVIQLGLLIWWIWAIYHRTKDCGWHGAHVLWVIVPFANIVYVLMLFFTRTKELPDYIEGESTHVHRS